MTVAEISELLLVEHVKSLSAINLVPSENRLSPTAQLPLRLDFYNRYFFNEGMDPLKWEFRGSEGVAEIEVKYGKPQHCRGYRHVITLMSAPYRD